MGTDIIKLFVKLFNQSKAFIELFYTAKFV